MLLLFKIETKYIVCFIAIYVTAYPYLKAYGCVYMYSKISRCHDIKNMANLKIIQVIINVITSENNNK